MTREGALYKYFSGFGMPAYPSDAVPDVITFPYLTYETTGGNWGDKVSIAVNLWFHTESETIPNDKTRQISADISLGGLILSYDDGKMWIKRGSPWSISLSDETDPTIKRRQLTIIIEDWRI